jgi:anaerobic selenocysteine-containing dehydrogenase
VQLLNVVLARLGQLGGVFLPAETAVEGFTPQPVASFAELRDLVGRMKSGLVDLLFVHGANPVFELPRAVGFSEALVNVPFVVSFNPAVDETAVHADLVLPDHTSLEGWGYHVPPLSERLILSGQQPVMRPLHNTRATVDVFLALAQRLGGALAQTLPWRNEVEFLKEMTGAWRPAGISADAFWSTWRRQGGWWPEGEIWRPPQPTAAFDQPLALSAPTFEGEPSEYPYILYVYPSIALFDGRGANKPWLQETPDPMTTVAWQTWVEIHPDTAQTLGVEDGDLVRIRSRAGGISEIEALVYVYPGIRRDLVAMPVGQGHDQYGRYARAQGSNPVKLLVPRVDDETGGLCWCATRVRIEPTGKRKALARLESPAGVEYVREEE